MFSVTLDGQGITLEVVCATADRAKQWIEDQPEDERGRYAIYAEDVLE